MPAKQILFSQAAHTKLLAGINTLAQAVRVTLGPKARTVVLAPEAKRRPTTPEPDDLL